MINNADMQNSAITTQLIKVKAIYIKRTISVVKDQDGQYYETNRIILVDEHDTDYNITAMFVSGTLEVIAQPITTKS